VRIVFATDWWPPRVGGVESQVMELASVLAGRGHFVHVLTTTKNPIAPPGVVVQSLETPMMGEIAVPDLRRVATLAAHIDAVSPDVVHAHGMFSSVGIGAILAASRLGIPSISTVHSLLRPWPVLVGASVVFRLFSNRASMVTAVSSPAVRDVEMASGQQAIRIANGVHLSYWSASGRRTGGEIADLRIVAVTRLVPKKSPVDLVHALRETMNRARERGDRSRRVTLTIAGDGPERSRLEKTAVALKVSDHLQLVGACSRDKVRELLATASFLAHPGMYEAFGLAILEARAAGVPVVAMAAGGVPDLVEHRRHGLLAQNRSDFPTAVAELALDDDLRAKCAQQAGRDLEPFDWSTVVSQHEGAYQRALEKRSGQHSAVSTHVNTTV
jgi:glycosyltransferase involved in cell wall biosynthesis